MAVRTIALYGTRHGHAEGKLIALRASPRIRLAGVYEPDDGRRAELARAGGAWAGLRWYASEAELLGDPGVSAVAAEGRNYESLAQAEAAVRAGKHLWYDKPAGEDLLRWRALLAEAEARGLHVQMGYMFRYHEGFRQIQAWAAEGLLGRVTLVRAQMSTSIPLDERLRIARHRGGILYDLGGHMLDQIVALLGRPERASAFLRHTDARAPHFADTTLAVLEYPQALAEIAICAGEAPPPARRLEVYGERGSAIMEPFEPCDSIRLCLAEPAGGLPAGERRVPVASCPRQELYQRELAAFLDTLDGARPPERSYQHDLLVQETLMRLVG